MPRQACIECVVTAIATTSIERGIVLSSDPTTFSYDALFQPASSDNATVLHARQFPITAAALLHRIVAEQLLTDGVHASRTQLQRRREFILRIGEVRLCQKGISLVGT